VQKGEINEMQAKMATYEKAIFIMYYLTLKEGEKYEDNFNVLLNKPFMKGNQFQNVLLILKLM
jgi:hypothetical protein